MASEIKANKISPATGTAFTLGDSGDTFTVPSGTTLDIASGATLDTTGATVSGLTTGKVLQVVQTLKTDTQSFTSSASFSDIVGLSVSITPSSTSSKILVSFSVGAGTGADQGHLMMQLLRDSTAIGLADAASSRTRNTGIYFNTAVVGQVIQNNFMILDSPNTTSSVTYKIQGMANSSTVHVNRSNRDNDASTHDGRCSSHITVMEIAV
jgi:hypothetical protein